MSQRSLIKSVVFGEGPSLKSVTSQLETLRRVDERFELINRETYRSFLNRSKLAKFAEFKPRGRTAEMGSNMLCRAAVFRLLVEFLTGPFDVIFFDTSTISPSSFKQKAWIWRTGRPEVRQKTSLKPVKIFAAVTVTELLALRIFNHSSSQTIANFLRHALRAHQNGGSLRQVVVYLDNATSHRSPEVLGLAEEFGLIFLFGPIESPSLNFAEACFEFLKRDLRQQTFNSDYQSVWQVIARAKKYGKNQISRAIRKEVPKMLKMLPEVDGQANRS